MNCAPEEKEVLLESATLVNNKMEEIRKSSSIIGLERIAVMTALNLAPVSYTHLTLPTTPYV